MLWRILITLLLTAAVALLLHLLRGSLLLPVPLGKHTELCVLLTVRGSAPELEQTVDALQWLRANHTLRGSIILRCIEPDKETRRAAELLQKRGLIEITDD